MDGLLVALFVTAEDKNRLDVLWTVFFSSLRLQRSLLWPCGRLKRKSKREAGLGEQAYHCGRYPTDALCSLWFSYYSFWYSAYP